MSYRNKRFNRSMRSLDTLLSSWPDPSKSILLCDNGKGLEQLLDEIDWSPKRERIQESKLVADRLTRQKTRLQRISAAISRLVESDKSYLVPTLLLIVRNGVNRKESERLVPERTYRRHRSELCSFFGVEP